MTNNQKNLCKFKITCKSHSREAPRGIQKANRKYRYCWTKSTREKKQKVFYSKRLNIKKQEDPERYISTEEQGRKQINNETYYASIGNV